MYSVTAMTVALFLLGPLVVIGAVGFVAGAIASAFASGAGAAAFGRRMSVLLVLAAVTAVAMSFELPRYDVNGPVGATCPDLSSDLGHLIAVLAVTAAVAAASVVAAATVEGFRHVQTGETFGRLALAAVVPYVAYAAWVVPAMCDYS
jgi:hypothetical protein